MNNDNQHIPSGYKLSPLGIIPEDWEVKRLGDFSRFFSGGTPKSGNPLFYNGDIPFIRSGEINKDRTELFLSQEGVDNSSAKLVEEGDILYALYGANSGQCSLSKIQGAINQAILCIRPKANKYYVMSVLQLNKEHYYNSFLQGGQGNLSGEIVSNYRLAIPPIEEQERVCNVLQLWDTAIAKQTALIEKLTLRKRGLMQQLLTGKKRLKGFSGEWEEVRLGEFGVFFKGGGVPKDSIISAGHKCLTYGDLYTKYDYVIFDVKSYIDDDTANESVKIQYGDICFAGSGETKEDIGKCAAFIDNEYGYAGGDIIVFRANDCNPITLSYILNSSDVIRQKSNMGQGHSVVHIYPYQLEKLLIKLPSRAEQDAIATILMESDKEIEIHKQKLAAMQEQKKGLMQVLLTGKKRVVKNNK
ncbi:MAG: restriction endonuclease subunit S [Paludibacteraceae bacterium]|nr:restriction endonuclease subunit S [Paludibacteraceae bacterium]